MAHAADLADAALNFSVTETSLLQHREVAQDYMAALRARGCRLALHEFGTQRSPFAQLTTLGVDVVKMGGHLMRDISESDVNQIYVKSMIDIAHRLELQVVAEAVDDERILSTVRQLGADLVQGDAVDVPQELSTLLPNLQLTGSFRVDWPGKESA